MGATKLRSELIKARWSWRLLFSVQTSVATILLYSQTWFISGSASRADSIPRQRAIGVRRVSLLVPRPNGCGGRAMLRVSDVSVGRKSPGYRLAGARCRSRLPLQYLEEFSG